MKPPTNIPLPLPSGLACPGCAYDLGNSPVPRCSECGRDVRGEDLVIHAARASLHHRMPGLLIAHLLLSVAIVWVMTVGVSVLTWRLAGFKPALAAMFACSVALAGSLIAGAIAARCTHPRDRYAAFECWRKSHLWLHGPWLCMPGCAIIVTVAAFFERQLGGNGHTTGWIVFIGLGCWTIWSALCAWWWWRRWRRAAGSLALISERARLFARAAAFVVLMGSLPLGLVGGLVATIAARTLAGLLHA